LERNNPLDWINHQSKSKIAWTFIDKYSFIPLFKRVHLYAEAQSSLIVLNFWECQLNTLRGLTWCRLIIHPMFSISRWQATV
jgi:hypothetical protein